MLFYVTIILTNMLIISIQIGDQKSLDMKNSILIKNLEEEQRNHIF